MLFSKLHCPQKMKWKLFSRRIISCTLASPSGGVVPLFDYLYGAGVGLDGVHPITPSPHVLDHIPLYSPVYGRVEGKGLVTSCLSLSQVWDSMAYTVQHRLPHRGPVYAVCSAGLLFLHYSRAWS